MMFDMQMTKKKTTATTAIKGARAILLPPTIVLSAAMVFLALLLSPLLSQQEAEAAYALLSPSDRDRVADRLEDLADSIEARGGFDEHVDKLRAEAAEARAGGGYDGGD